MGVGLGVGDGVGEGVGDAVGVGDGVGVGVAVGDKENDAFTKPSLLIWIEVTFCPEFRTLIPVPDGLLHSQWSNL